MWASATAGMQAVEDVSKVVIPTHMWASATSVNGFVPKFNRVVIPTHMWASATSYRSVLCFGCFRCYTHSYVGFCNLIIQHLYRKHLKALLYPLICGLLQHDEARLEAVAGKGCYTHSYVGFCNKPSWISVSSLTVVIPTHMWASATN